MKESTEKLMDGLDPRDSDSWPVWLTVPETAAVMRLAVSTIRGLTQSSRLRSRRFGRQIRVSKAALLAYLDESGNCR